jgi:ribonuclease T
VSQVQDTVEAPSDTAATPMSRRFRGFLPVIIDVETGGFNSRTDALLEVAAVLVRFNAAGDLEPWESHR